MISNYPSITSESSIENPVENFENSRPQLL